MRWGQPARTLHIPFLLQAQDCYASFLRHFSTFLLGFLASRKDSSFMQGILTLLCEHNFLALSNKSVDLKHFCSPETLPPILILWLIPLLVKRAPISSSNSVSCFWLSWLWSSLSSFHPCLLCSLLACSTEVPWDEFKPLTGGCFLIWFLCKNCNSALS